MTFRDLITEKKVDVDYAIEQIEYALGKNKVVNKYMSNKENSPDYRPDEDIYYYLEKEDEDVILDLFKKAKLK